MEKRKTKIKDKIFHLNKEKYLNQVESTKTFTKISMQSVL